MGNGGCGWFTLRCMQVFLLCCIVCAGIIGAVSAAALIEQPRKIETTSLTPTLVTCPAPYECLATAVARSKWPGGIVLSGSSPCGYTINGSTEYCYRSSLTAGSPVSNLGKVTTTPTAAVFKKVTASSLEKAQPDTTGQTGPNKVVARVITNAVVPAKPAETNNIVSSLAIKEPLPLAKKKDRSFIDSFYSIVFCQMKDLCDGTCVDLKNDPANCGSCGEQCSQGQSCMNGICGKVCPLGTVECRAGDCRNLLRDNDFCGTCNNSCLLGQICCNGNCVNLQTDNANCGNCGNTCEPGSLCKSTNQQSAACTYPCNGGYFAKNDRFNCGMSFGQCGKVCSDGYVCSDLVPDINHGAKHTGNYDCVKCAAWGNPEAPMVQCGNDCKDLSQDNNNCGSCGHSCGLGTCTNGRCIQPCDSGLSRCGDNCVNLLNDFHNCGTCGQGCWSGDVCSFGVCKETCNAGYTNCNGKCVDLKSDRLNCGACNQGVWPGDICANGKIMTCNGNLFGCDNICRDLMSDRLNCGQCGNYCSNACYQGKCM